MFPRTGFAQTVKWLRAGSALPEKLFTRARPYTKALKADVLHGARPAIGGASLAGVPQKQLSLLMFPSADDKQARALLTSSVTTLRDAGAMVVVGHSSAEVRGVEHAEEIARWMLLQKLR